MMDQLCLTELIEDGTYVSGNIRDSLTTTPSLASQTYSIDLTWTEARTGALNEESVSHYQLASIAWANGEDAGTNGADVVDSDIGIFPPSYGPFPRAGCWTSPKANNYPESMQYYYDCLQAKHAQSITAGNMLPMYDCV